MNHGQNVGAHPINGQMHGDFGCTLARPFHLVAVQIANDQIAGRHHSLADAGAGAQHSVVIQADADVAIVSGNPAFLVDQFADIHDILPVVLLRLAHPHQTRYALASREGILNCSNPDAAAEPLGDELDQSAKVCETT